MTEIAPSPADDDRFGSPLLPRYRAAVLPEWADRNEHLNNSYYLVAVQSAYVSALRLWRGEADRERSSTGNFTMQSLVTHVRELKLGANLLIVPRLLAVDEKRTHVLIELYNADKGFLGAVIEKTSINVIRGRPPKVANFSDEMRDRLQAVARSHAEAPMPSGIRPVLALNPRAQG
ncbi:MAG TPA: thioesterase family protein [Beijerinckiaceae bacterium]|nr:thioesterase family protein [Beijerinckiaceae bacterium]